MVSFEPDNTEKWKSIEKHHHCKVKIIFQCIIIFFVFLLLLHLFLINWVFIYVYIISYFENFCKTLILTIFRHSFSIFCILNYEEFWEREILLLEWIQFIGKMNVLFSSFRKFANLFRRSNDDRNEVVIEVPVTVSRKR